MHFQTSVDNWDKAFVQMPDYPLLKAVNDLGLLHDGRNKWIAAGRDPNKLYLCHRYHDFWYPDFDGWARNFDFDEWCAFWLTNFAKTIDGTYYERYAPIVRLVEELNEYTDTRMITDKNLLAPRIASARAAVHIWNTEYRGRLGIPSDARLVVCNNPVGNDIPIEYFQLCRDEDAVLGTHLYTHWINKQRDPDDFRWHSGRTFHNEEQYGIKVDYAITESGPYAGVLEGWRHSNVMGGDRNLLIEGMTAWWDDLAQTAAYKEGRILGPGAWFTSSRINDQWNYYRLWESELTPLAEAAMIRWEPGSGPPPPDPEPEPEPEPVPYIVVVNLLPQDTTLEEKWAVLNEVHETRETMLQSADDAARLVAPGRMGSKVKAWGAERWNGDIIQWLGDRGVELVEVLDFPNGDEDFKIQSPLPIPLQVTSPFNVQRDYGRHEGIDLRAVDSAGQPVYILAVADGTVVWASDIRRSDGKPSDYGKHIIVDHGNNFVTWYCHLDDIYVAYGNIVESGEWIGLAGNTGNSTGIHLHFNIQDLVNGLDGYVVSKVVDPAPYLGLG